MKLAQLNSVLSAHYPVIARIPSSVRRRVGLNGYAIGDYICGIVVSVITGKKYHESVVVVRYGMGNEVELFARNILRIKGRGDIDDSRYSLRNKKILKDKSKRNAQMRLI